MKVKIEDFLLAMGEYCKEHDVEECLQGKCGLSVDHDDPGNGDEYNGCIMFGCDHPKYAKMIKKEILKHMKERRKHRRKEKYYLRQSISMRYRKMNGWRVNG